MGIIIREIKEQDYVSVVSIGNNELNCKNTIDDAIIHYSRIKDDERYKTFVAVDHSDIVGFISSVWSYDIGYEVGFMHIVGLAVKKEKQNMGIGKKLLEYMEQYAKDKGISGIVLNSGVQRTAAHAFYQNNGYDKRSWCFSKRI